MATATTGVGVLCQLPNPNSSVWQVFRASKSLPILNTESKQIQCSFAPMVSDHFNITRVKPKRDERGLLPRDFFKTATGCSAPSAT